MEKERIYYWDNLKCFLIFLVVLGHFLIPVMNRGRSLQATYYFVYLFHMPAFILVSGYFAKNYLKKDVPNVNKLFGFLILYVVYKGLIWLTDSLLIGKMADFDLFSETSAPWYLLGMFTWYMILPVFAKFKSGVSISIAVLFGLLIGFEDQFGPFLCLSKSIIFLPFFLVGYYLKEDIVQKLTSRKMRITSAIILIICAISIVSNLQVLKSFEGMLYGNRQYSIFSSVVSLKQAMLVRGLWYIIAFIMVFAVMSLIPRRKLKISYIGSRTLSIYIVHRIIRQVFSHYKVYQMVASGGIMLLLFCIAVSVLVTFILSGKILFKIFNKAFLINYDKLKIKDSREE